MNSWIGDLIGVFMVVAPPFLVIPWFYVLPVWVILLGMIVSMGIGAFCLVKYWIPYIADLDVKEWESRKTQDWKC